MTPEPHGPDVAHYQHVTDEAAVPAWGLASCKLAEGRSYFDPTAPKWIALFRRKKVRCLGVYFWIRGDSTVEAQFANVVARLQQTGLDVGGKLAAGVMIQLDWETTPNVRPVTVSEVEQFSTLVHDRYGDRLITYVSDWVPGFSEWRRRNPRAPLWYANYNTGTTPTGGYAECAKYDATVWQYTSSYKGGGIASGTPGVPSSDTGYDMNHVRDWDTLDRICRNSALVSVPPVVVLPPVVVPPVLPTRPTPSPDPIPVEGTEMDIITNAEPLADGAGKVHDPLTLKWKLVVTHEPLYRAAWLAPWEHEAAGFVVGRPLSNAVLKAIGEWVPPPVAAVAAVADVAAVAAVAPVAADHGTWSSEK